MFKSDDSAYYTRRIETELRLAREAKDPGVRKIHLSMAAEYRLRVAETVSDQQKSAGATPLVISSGHSRSFARSV